MSATQERQVRACPNCAAPMASSRETRAYAEAGLEHVALRMVEVLRCGTCGREQLRLPNVEQLHLLLAGLIATSVRRLRASEIRFLRKYTGMSSATFAARIHTTDETVLAWESGASEMPLWPELRLRVIALREKPIAVEAARAECVCAEVSR